MRRLSALSPRTRGRGILSADDARCSHMVEKWVVTPVESRTLEIEFERHVIEIGQRNQSSKEDCLRHRLIATCKPTPYVKDPLGQVRSGFH